MEKKFDYSEKIPKKVMALPMYVFIGQRMKNYLGVI